MSGSCASYVCGVAWFPSTYSLAHPHQLRQRSGLHFLHDVMTMHLDGDLGHIELRGRPFVRHAANDESHHLTLASCQRLVSFANLFELAMLGSVEFVPLECLPDRIQEFLLA